MGSVDEGFHVWLLVLKYFRDVATESNVAPVCRVITFVVGFLQFVLGLWMLFTMRRPDRRNVAITLAALMSYDLILHLPIDTKTYTAYSNDVQQFLATIGVVGGLLMIAGLREHK